MKCLWLTLADPDPPFNGQFLYSSGLIHSAAAAGMELCVVGFSMPGGEHQDGKESDGISWRLAPHRPRSRFVGIFSALPQLASRTKTRAMQQLVRELLHADRWDAIVVDSFNLGWALAMLDEVGRPPLVYIAHNHETSLAIKTAAAELNPLKRIAKRLDAAKVARLEASLVAHAGLVTSNTPEDCAQFRNRSPNTRVMFLPPGYSGMVVGDRHVTTVTPRRAIIVGSFDWVVKRQSLIAFLAVADPLFARAGIELYVVGQAEAAFLAELRRSVRATIFTGRVADVTPYMREARLALVPDQMPGFKLKGLDYVFNRLPIFALSGSLPGMPLVDGRSARFYPDHERLAAGVIASIDDVAALDRLQEAAHAACRDQFDWREIGCRLRNAIEQSVAFSDVTRIDRSDRAAPTRATASG